MFRQRKEEAGPKLKSIKSALTGFAVGISPIALHLSCCFVFNYTRDAVLASQLPRVDLGLGSCHNRGSASGRLSCDAGKFFAFCPLSLDTTGFAGLGNGNAFRLPC